MAHFCKEYQAVAWGDRRQSFLNEYVNIGVMVWAPSHEPTLKAPRWLYE